MGGNAFAAPAARLSNPEYEALRAHLLSRLDAFDPVDTAPYLSSKASHGDIDVLVGWDKAGWENGKGRGCGKVTDETQSSDSLHSALAAAGVSDVTFNSAPEALDIWCDTIAAHIGGTHWYRSGGQLSVAIPTSVIRAGADTEPGATPLPSASRTSIKINHLAEDHPFADLQPHTFAQVDLLLIPPPGVAFQRFAHGYGHTVLLLSQLLRRASSCRDFVLHGHCAILRWAPYPGCPKAEVQLTHDPAALCAYLGLDYGKWGLMAPATVEDLFAWLADCAADSRAARGLREMARYGLVEGTYRNQGGVSRLPVLDEFGGWLRAHGWVYEERERKAGDEKANDEDEPNVETNELSKREPKRDARTTKTVKVVPPSQPRSLPSAHAALLRYWGKEAEYAAAVEAIRPIAELHWSGAEKRKAEAERKAAEEATMANGAKAAKEPVPSCASICIAV